MESSMEKNTVEFHGNRKAPIFVVAFETEIGHGSLVVKITNSWLTCHEFEPSAAEDPSCLGGQCTSNLSRLHTPSIGVVWKSEGSASSGAVLVTLSLKITKFVANNPSILLYSATRKYLSHLPRESI
ncbi:hypothetical protein TNCV_2878671 [Trichonephila clavipes]|uniref:Uncharacterized protein n=1 Tax=Trichonephila clavipes TaxID=2585209 RepID=A0A8X7BDJ9_TRICX|nr:hypothetical protein TNCV_2878671 [Trichonephila clavipes]